MAEFEPSVRPDEVEIAAEQLDVIFETSLRAGLTNRSATRCCLPAQSALDADRDLFDAELGLAQTRRNELLVQVQLYRALGGGWQQ